MLIYFHQKWSPEKEVWGQTIKLQLQIMEKKKKNLVCFVIYQT